MAGEEQDKESKTEEASEKKTRDAIERGNVPHSREAAIFVSLFATLIALSYMIGDRSLQLGLTLSRFIGQAAELPLENIADVGRVLQFSTHAAIIVVAPITVLLIVAGFVASFAQNPPRFAYDRIKPQLSRISLTAGWQRLFGVQGAIEFLKALFKLTAVGVVLSA